VHGKRSNRTVINCVTRFVAGLPDVRGQRILLALSGGADSVALFHALMALRRKFGFELAAAHLNHNLRGAESDRDESFVGELCARHGVELTVERAHGLNLEPGNLEARARAARRQFLTRAAALTNSRYIAMAHQADDQAETVMLRLLRGSGVTGLGAMAEVEGTVIRPLLQVPRSALRAYLAELGERFVEDSSNQSLRYDRNRVRHHLMPLMEREYAPGLRQRLVEMAAEMRRVDDLLATLAAGSMGECLNPDGSLDVVALRRVHPAVLAAVMRRFVAARAGDLWGFERSHIEALRKLCIKDAPNGEIVLPSGWRAKRRYGKLLLVQGEEHNDVAAAFEVPLPVNAVTAIAPARAVFQSILMARTSARMPDDTSKAIFDAQALAPGLAVRNFIPGDRIVPLGVAGSRKLKDVFIEHKIPIERRRRFPVVVLDGRVAWLPGLVRSNLALVTDRTSEVLELSVSSEHCTEFNPHDSV
jgi:tRNA(Ile)-lysidine synthase